VQAVPELDDEERTKRPDNFRQVPIHAPSLKGPQSTGGKDRNYIKGQCYTLLSQRNNLSLDGTRP